MAQELETYKNYYKGLEVSIPGTNSFKTIDGVEGLLNALDFLQQMKPISPLQSLSAGLSRSAQDLCDDNGSKGLVGNTLSDGTSAPNRFLFGLFFSLFFYYSFIFIYIFFVYIFHLHFKLFNKLVNKINK